MAEIYESITTNYLKILEYIEGSQIIIIEGFQFVGKHRFMEMLEEDLFSANKLEKPLKVFSYRPDYDIIDYKSHTDLEDRYMLKVPILEMFGTINEVLKDSNNILILDKAVFSDFVAYMLETKTSEGYSLDQYNKIAKMFSIYTKFLEHYKVSVIHIVPETGIVKDYEAVEQYFGSMDEYFRQLSASDIYYNDAFNAYKSFYPNTTIKFIKYYNKDE